MRSHPVCGMPSTGSATLAPNTAALWPGLRQYPAETFSPCAQISPTVPSGQALRVSASTISSSGETGTP